MDQANSSSSSSISGDGNKPVAGAPNLRPPLCAKWSSFTSLIQNSVRRFVIVLAVHAARHPVIYVLGITILSLATLATGWFTNFRLLTDYEVMYAPQTSITTINTDWIYHESGFKDLAQPLSFLIHDRGNNVLSKQGVRQIFQVLETIQNTKGFDQVCSQGQYTLDLANGTGTNDCFAIAITRYWQHNITFFEEETQSDEDVMRALSSKKYPGGIPLEHDYILGKSQMSKTNNTKLVYAESFIGTVLLPSVPGVKEFELEAIKSLLKLRQQWQDAGRKGSADGSDDGDKTMQLECASINAYTMEFTRAIFADIPLAIFVGVIMIAFCCLVFFKWHKVKSRTLLGFAAVFTVTMSLSFGCGLMFIAGVPFTNMTMIFPFVLYGVGLDDTFVITGSFFRKDPKKDVILRVEETMEEVGLAITMTTVSTVLAFALGMGSAVPAIFWLCLYALVTLSIDFVFQVTLFVAFLVLDERRVQANRRDFCFCIKGADKDGEPPDDRDNEHDMERSEPNAQSWEGRLVRLFADKLLKPWVQGSVLLVFLGYFGFCIYRATLLTQEFNVEEFLPKDSFAISHLRAIEDYAQEMISIGVYFRHTDQSEEGIQQQMKDYIDTLVDGRIGEEPDFCWVLDFARYQEFAGEFLGGFDLNNLTFTQKMTLALSDPRVKEVYGSDIVTDEDGDVVASRCWIRMSKVDFKNVRNQTETLRNQRAITASQPINQAIDEYDELPFFSMADTFFLWEFYDIAVQELIFNTVSGIVAVTVVAILVMPHWTAVAFVLPLIIIVYVDMLGTLQLCGLHINVVTYVCLVVSIGLLVDFIMHILLRYYESPGGTRQEKVKDTLETMGVSVLVGGLSTFLGVIPLAWSTSKIIGTVFTCFFVMVTLGVLHGLVFLPVVLSLVGPSFMVAHSKQSLTKDEDTPHEQTPTETECTNTRSRVLSDETELNLQPSLATASDDAEEPSICECQPVMVQVESQLEDGMIEAGVAGSMVPK